jgi:hypothetical protein
VRILKLRKVSLGLSSFVFVRVMTLVRTSLSYTKQVFTVCTIANTAQLGGDNISILMCWLCLAYSNADQLRRLELYGVDKTHPYEEPRRQQAAVLVFHMADMETCDASYVFFKFCVTMLCSQRYQQCGANILRIIGGISGTFH